MGTYVPNTKEEQMQMLNEIGYKSFDDLFCDIPEEVRLKEELNLPHGISEMEASMKMEKIAKKIKFINIFLEGQGHIIIIYLPL